MGIIKATFCAVAVVTSMSACGGGVLHDAAPTDRSSAPVATSEPASPCSSATPDDLKSAAIRQFFSRSHPEYAEILVVEKVRCASDWAMANIHIPHDPNTNPPGLVLYHHDGGNAWRAVQYGSGFDCIPEGVPPPIAAQLEC